MKAVFKSSQVFFWVGIAFSFLTQCSHSSSFTAPFNLKLPKQENSFSLLTFNTQAIFGKDSTKLASLSKYINQQKFDLVTLQELFNEEARDKFISMRDTTVYISLVPIINYTSFPENIFNDAGLYIQSSFPQINLETLNTNSYVEKGNGALYKMLEKEVSISTDFLANKSVAGTLFSIDDSTKVYIATTHVQAIGSSFLKRSQLRQIRKFIEYSVYKIVSENLVSSPKNLIVILTGDFNINAYSRNKYNYLLRMLGNPRDLHAEVHKNKEQYSMYIPPIGKAMRFDYVFSYDRLLNYSLKRIEPLTVEVTDIVTKDSVSVSDHNAIISLLKY